MTITDPFDVLRLHLRSTAAPAEPTISDDDLIAAIVDGTFAMSFDDMAAQRSRRQRRRRRVAVGAVVAVAASGGLAVAARNWSEPAKHPESGVSCYSDYATMTNQFVLGVQS